MSFKPLKKWNSLLSELRRQISEYNEAQHSLASPDTNSGGLALPRFQRQLKDYQVPCVLHHLNSRHGANFSVPGSGKTTMIYAAFDALYSSGIVEKLLVVGPISSFMPWEEEYEGCFGVQPRSARITGDPSLRQHLYEASGEFDIFLCHYRTAANDVASLIELCKKHKFFVVIDESHNIKKMDGVYSDALIRLAPFAARRAILSGTPMPNDYRDLWTQFTFLWPRHQLLGDLEVYKYRCGVETRTRSNSGRD